MPVGAVSKVTIVLIVLISIWGMLLKVVCFCFFSELYCDTRIVGVFTYSSAGSRGRCGRTAYRCTYRCVMHVFQLIRLFAILLKRTTACTNIRSSLYEVVVYTKYMLICVLTLYRVAKKCDYGDDAKQNNKNKQTLKKLH